MISVVVLAAGEGTRMRSAALPKVLHGFAGRSMLGHVLAAVAPLRPVTLAVVVGHRREEVTTHLEQIAPEAIPVVQQEQNGTGHATRLALTAADVTDGTVLVLPGDTPLLTAATLTELVQAHTASGAAATVLTSVVPDPSGYGRIIRTPEGDVARIVEHKDASDTERAVPEVNTAVFAFDAALLAQALTRLTTDNAQGEEYLTDVVGILAGDGHRVAALAAAAEETAGVNDRLQLSAASRTYNDRLLREHMLAGVTVADPATTWVDATVRLDPDVTLLPATELRGDTVVAAGAVVGPQSSLTDTAVGAGATIERTVARSAVVGAGASVGPFAYLRPGTVLGERAHVGTYVELKNAQVGAGTKVPHLTYVGDATIGTGTNIGAATVFVNYDGVTKSHTTVGDHVRIGSDTMLVAPVTIGDGAYTAAGSVITQDVPPGALGVSRGTQRNVADWVLRRRAGTASADAADKAKGSDEHS